MDEERYQKKIMKWQPKGRKKVSPKLMQKGGIQSMIVQKQLPEED